MSPSPFLPLGLLLFLGPFLLSSLPAQIREADAIHVRALSVENPYRGLFVLVGSDYVPLDLSAFSPSDYLNVGPQRTLDFFQQTPDPENPEVMTWSRLARTTLPGSATHYTLIFYRLPRPTEDGSLFQIMTLNDGASQYRSGTLRFINLSPFPVMGRVGDSDLNLASGQSSHLTPPLDNKGRAYIQLAYQNQGQWSLFSRGPVSLTRERRATIITAYSSRLAAALQIEGNTLPDGRARPEMMVSIWTDPAADR